MLNRKRLWPGDQGYIVQAEEKTKIWQLRKRHGKSGELYCVEEGKYLNFVEVGNNREVVLGGSSNGTKWQFI